jgi:putative radical SAM enzyme (TIGR03279 family)
VAVVPVGLTRFRERLPKLETADAAYAAAMLREVTRWGVALARRIGTRFVWLSDEWYNLAGKPVPSARHYEDFPQYEDGVGTIRSFLDAARRVARRLPPEAAAPVTGAVVTARLAAPVVSGFVDRLNAVEGVSLQTLVVANRFFGDTINVAGLMTGQDILATLREHPGPGPVYLPSICLKDDYLFLDDMTVDSLASAAGRQVIVVDITPAALAQAVGLL